MNPCKCESQCKICASKEIRIIGEEIERKAECYACGTITEIPYGHNKECWEDS